MAKFETLIATAAPLEQRDVNTDAVIPGRFLRRKREEGFGECLFRDLRFHALHDYGIRCVIAPSFGDIFHNNCFKNGLLPIVLPEAEVTELRAQAGTMQGTPFAIDLAAQTVTGVDGVARRFEIDPFRKRLLLEGVDEIDFTLGHMDKIKAFEAKR